MNVSVKITLIKKTDNNGAEKKLSLVQLFNEPHHRHSGIPCRHYREVVLVHPTVSELMPWVLDGIREVMEAGT
ncbi:MAG: hypothetical protein OHK0053_36090 [Microscillaceae bacterium]